jgi:hypothetical protein
MTLPEAEQSPASKALQKAGISKEDITSDTTDIDAPSRIPEQLQIKLLSEHAKMPYRATKGRSSRI